MRLPSWVDQHLAALRALLVMTVVVGLAYPLAILAVAQIPGLKSRADGSLVTAGGRTVGSSLIGQSFVDPKGEPLKQYLQSRPSAAGAAGYDPTATGASNLGPENVVDALPNPTVNGDTGKPSLLTQVCTRSAAIGRLDGVDGRRPYCTPDGVGAVLAVFHRDGLTGPVTRVVSLNQACPATPFVPPGTASASSAPDSARTTPAAWSPRSAATPPPRRRSLRTPSPRAAAASIPGSAPPTPGCRRRGSPSPRVSTAQVLGVIDQNTSGRTLGFLGEPAVNVLSRQPRPRPSLPGERVTAP